MKFIRISYIFFGLCLFLGSCSSYQKILKSSDLNYKYDKGLEYYANEDYIKAFPLFDELLLLYRGTDKAEEVYYYYCQTEYKKGNLLSAAYHFNNFANTYKNNIHTEECAYLTVNCYYLLSPKYSLDQLSTFKALDEIDVFLDKYPSSSYVPNCVDLRSKLDYKIEKKSFENAKLYFTTENYKSAIHALNQTLLEYQNSLFKEEILFLLLQSYYLLAENSIDEKKEKRIKDAIFAFNQFKNSYPESDFMIESKRIFKQAKLLRKN